MTSDGHHSLKDTGVALLAFVALAAPAVVIGHAQRSSTRLGFAHAPRSVSETVAILHANVAHAWAPLLVMAVLVQARRVLGGRFLQRAFVWLFDLLVVVIVFYTVAVPMGQVIGASGWRAARSMLPAGPVELLAYALAASIYMDSRRTLIREEQLPGLAGIAAVSAAALVTAALLETFL